MYDKYKNFNETEKNSVMELRDYSNNTGYNPSGFESDYSHLNGVDLEPKEEKELGKDLYKNKKKRSEEELLPIEILNPKKDDWKYWR